MSSRKKLKAVASSTEVAVAEAARARQALAGFPAAPAAPDLEVRAVAKRQQFRTAYTFSVLEQTVRASSPGAIGARQV